MENASLADSASSKPLKGKYDRRYRSVRSKAAIDGAACSGKRLGRKPNWMKHLSRNSAYEMLQEFDAIAPPAEIYRYCWEHKLMPLVIGMREYVWNRLEGRPFVAENPEEKAKGPNALNDNRIQMYVQQLLPQPKVKRAVTAKALPAAVTVEPGPDANQEPGEPTEQD